MLRNKYFVASIYNNLEHSFSGHSFTQQILQPERDNRDERAREREGVRASEKVPERE